MLQVCHRGGRVWKHMPAALEEQPSTRCLANKTNEHGSSRTQRLGRFEDAFTSLSLFQGKMPFRTT
jgi:hypothetical protein